MMPGGQHVDDGDRRVARELLGELVRAGADADRRDVSGQDVRGVANRLATGQLELLGTQHHRVPAELRNPGLKRDASAR